MNTKPRILMLLENESFPDDNRVLLEAKTLADVGFELSVICPTGQSRKWIEKIGDVRVYRYPKPIEIDGFTGYLWEYSYSLIFLFVISIVVLIRHGFDAVHIHTPPDMTAIIAIFYQLIGKKFVFDHHDLSPELYMARRNHDKETFVVKALLFFERMACRRADRLIATNETQRNIQINRCGADATKCYVVRNGPNEFFLDEVKPRQELLKPGRLVLGYVGVIGIQDGVDYLVRMVHELKFRHRREDFIVVIVGGGPALTNVKKLADELNVADRLQFVGTIPFPSVPSYISAFDICLTPDPSNPYNNSCTTIKTMEYMALSKPTVCFRTTENELTAGSAALYAEDNDVTAFAELTVRLMNDSGLRESMGEIARERIEEGLTWDQQKVVLLFLYDELFDLPARESCQEMMHNQLFSRDLSTKPSVTKSLGK